jgi:hypothetical protein
LIHLAAALGNKRADDESVVERLQVGGVLTAEVVVGWLGRKADLSAVVAER